MCAFLDCLICSLGLLKNVLTWSLPYKYSQETAWENMNKTRLLCCPLEQRAKLSAHCCGCQGGSSEWGSSFTCRGVTGLGSDPAVTSGLRQVLPKKTKSDSKFMFFLVCSQFGISLKTCGKIILYFFAWIKSNLNVNGKWLLALLFWLQLGACRRNKIFWECKVM